MKGIIYHEYGLYTGFTRAPDYGRPYSTGVATCKNPARDIAKGDKPLLSGAPAPIQSREPGAAKQHLNPNGGDVRSNPSASSRHLPY